MMMGDESVPADENAVFNRASRYTVVDPFVPAVGFGFAEAQRSVLDADAVVTPLLPEGYTPGQRLDAIASGSYLTQLRVALEREAGSLAQTYTTSQWLWYTRRLPTAALAGGTIISEGNRRMVLELLSGLSRSDNDENRILTGHQIAYPADPESLAPVAKLATLAVALAKCHAWLRRAGKGIEFTVQADTLPVPVLNQAIDRAIELYDWRTAQDLRLPWHAFVSDLAETSESTPLLGVHLLANGWQDVPGWRGPLKDQLLISVRGQFVVQWMSLDGLKQTLANGGVSGQRWWPPYIPSLVVLLHSLWYESVFNGRALGVSLPQVGYTVRQAGYTEQILDDVLPIVADELEAIFPGEVPDSGEHVIGELLDVGPGLWPRRAGPIARSTREFLLLDVASATSRLHQDVLYPPKRAGKVAVVVATAFEDAVQEVIDQTPWRPELNGAELRRLRGLRQLRIDGVDLTDIDAVGELADLLLVVDCKNYALTDEYDAGEHSVVRNLASALDDAVSHWADVISRLRERRKGDNFDLSMFDDVAGIVVTPRVVYSSSNSTLADVEIGGWQTRGAVGLGEFRDFLMRAAGPAQ